MDSSKVNSGDPRIDAAITSWLQYNPPESNDYAAISKLVTSDDYATLKKLFSKRQEFGTAGIRGNMGPGYAQMNDLVIIQTSQGLARYILSVSDTAKADGVVIGHDARYNSSRWANLTAAVFLRLGYKVYLFSTIVPTPFVPFSVQRKRAAVGIVITASHNPRNDNGYKVYWSNGPQILPPHDKNIQNSILEHLEPSAGLDSFDEHFVEGFNETTSPALVDPLGEVSKAYFDAISSDLFNKEMNEKCCKTIVYTAMHGVGANYIDMAVAAAGFKPLVHVKEQREPDPNFPTVEFPNPEEGKSSLELAIRTAEQNGSIYILANDPDVDRLAVAEKLETGWKIFTGNEIGTLLGWWQFQVHMTKYPDTDKSKLYFLASTVSSKMLRSIAKEEELSFDETLTGFKWMANRSHELEQDKEVRVLLAFEEAIGFMCGTNVLDKDGVSALVRTMELIAFLNKRKMTLAEKLKNLYDVYGYHYSKNSYFVVYDQEIIDRIFSRLRSFQGRPDSYPETLSTSEKTYKILSVRDLTTGFDSSQPDGKAKLPTSKSSHMITFQLDNGVDISIRTSGTEPKLKYYTEYCAKPHQKDWTLVETELTLIVQALIEEFLQPEKNGLIPRSD